MVALLFLVMIPIIMVQGLLFLMTVGARLAVSSDDHHWHDAGFAVFYDNPYCQVDCCVFWCACAFGVTANIPDFQFFYSI